MVDQVLGVELERKIVWVEAQIWVAWGEICASRAPNDFSRPSETPNTPTHLPDDPKIRPKKDCDKYVCFFFKRNIYAF